MDGILNKGYGIKDEILTRDRYVFATFQSNLILPNIMSLQSNAQTDADTTARIEFQRAQTRTIPTSVFSSYDPLSITPTKVIPSYLTLFIFAHMFLVILCYDALRLKNTIQVIGICVFNLAMLIYAAIQMDQIKDANWALGEAGDDGLPLRNKDIWNDIRPFLITIPCVIALSTILMSVVCWKLYDEFAWRIYKHISADLRMKKRYLTFQVSCSNWRGRELG
jgi:hypothetical protein